jgi:hypothetical protein
MLLVVVFAFGLAWVFTTVGLIMRAPNAVMNTGFMVLFPLIFLSNIFVSPDHAARLAGGVRRRQPDLAADHGGPRADGRRRAGGDIALVLGIAAAMTAVFAPLTARLYRSRGEGREASPSRWGTSPMCRGRSGPRFAVCLPPQLASSSPAPSPPARSRRPPGRSPRPAGPRPRPSSTVPASPRRSRRARRLRARGVEPRRPRLVGRRVRPRHAVLRRRHRQRRRLETDRAGTRFVGWTSAGNGFLSTAPAGGAFGPAEGLGRAAEVDVAVAPSGAAVVAWRVRESRSANRLLVARKPAGGPLGTPQEVVAGAVVSDVAAAVDDAGNAVVAFRQNVGRYVVRASLSSADGPFGAPATVSQQPEGGSAMLPGVAFSSTGVPVVLWSQSGTDAGTRAAALGPDGTGPVPRPSPARAASPTPSRPSPAAAPSRPSTAASRSSSPPRAPTGASARRSRSAPPAATCRRDGGGVDAAGVAHVAWGRPDDGALLVAEGTPGGGFRTLGQVDWVQPGAGALDVAAGATGTAVVSWLRVAADGQSVLASVHRRGSTVNPPVGPRPVPPADGPGPGSGRGGSGSTATSPDAPKLRVASRTVKLSRSTTLPFKVTSDKAVTRRSSATSAPRARDGRRGLRATTRTARTNLRAGRATTVGSS